jgi:Putative restriction endonuclease
VSQTAPSYRWSVSEFVRAFDAGAFDHRVELIDGEVWPVVIGSWHGDLVFQLAALLPRTGARVTAATLPTGESLPDPDCWVRRKDARPISTLGTRLDVWSPADVLLVVEVSDRTVLADLGTKARLYGSTGYPVYWVVTSDVIYEHTDPVESGYRRRVEYRAGDRLPVAYARSEIVVDELLRSV